MHIDFPSMDSLISQQFNLIKNFRCTVIALQRVIYFQLLKRNTKTTNNEINVFALTVACRLAACSKRPMFSKCPGFVAF